MRSVRTARGLTVAVVLALSTIVVCSSRAFAQLNHIPLATSRVASGFLFDSSLDRDTVFEAINARRSADEQLSGQWGCYLPESIRQQLPVNRPTLPRDMQSADASTMPAPVGALAVATFSNASFVPTLGALGDEYRSAWRALAAFDAAERLQSPVDASGQVSRREVDGLFTTRRAAPAEMLVTLY
jgi:hypothetical protein